MEKKKKLPGVAIALIVLLAIRALGQLLVAASIGGVGTLIFLVLAGVYIAAIVGTVQRKKWAPMLVIGIGILDAIASVSVLEGGSSFGAILMDVILVTLAFYDKKNIEGGMKPKKSE